MTINETVQNELRKLAAGEIPALKLSAENCSINYLKYIISTSKEGSFTARVVKGTHFLEVTNRQPKTVSFVNSIPGSGKSEIDQSILFADPDFEEEDFKGF